MEQYAEVVLDLEGNAVPGATVQVLAAGGAPASLFDKNGNPITGNTVTTGARGEFAFQAPNGKYTLLVTVRGSVYATVGPLTFYDPADDVDRVTQAGLGGAITGAIDDALAGLKRQVSVFDFMTPAQIADVESGIGAIDVTAAWDAAQRAGWRVLIPAGTHRLTNFRPIQGKRFEGEGYYATKIKQGNNAQYAFNCLSDATVGPDHLWGVSLVGVGFHGEGDETQFPINVSGSAGYSVQGGEFDFACRNTFGCLRVFCPEAANVYNCSFTVHADGYRGLGVRADGAYNDFNLFLTGTAATTQALDSWAAASTFHKVVTENRQVYNGYNCTILDAKVEFWSGASCFSAILVNGTNNRLVNFAVISVRNEKANCALEINGNTSNTILGGWVQGNFATGDCPQYGVILGDGSSGTIGDVRSDAPQKVDFKGWNVLKKWQFIGDVSTITDFQRAPNRMRYKWAVPASGDTVTLLDSDDALYLQANVASVTIALPPNPDDGQIFRVGSTGAIGAVTWSAGPGKTVDGQIPTALSAGATIGMMYLGSQGQTRWVPLS